MGTQDVSQEVGGDSESKRGSQGSGSVAADQVELDAIESLDTQQGNNKEKGSDIDEPTETQPLQAAANADADPTKKSAMAGEDVEAGDEEAEGKPVKRQWDLRCIVVGAATLLLIVGGAVTAILVRRFTGEEPYEFQFGSLYRDDMVLQRAPLRAVIYGFTPPVPNNTTVTVKLQGESVYQEHVVHVKNTGARPIWKVLLEPVGETGPMLVSAILEGYENHDIQLKDVLFGDVWVCAGEDNMQFSVSMLSEEQQKKEIEMASKKQDMLRIMSLSAFRQGYRGHHRDIMPKLHWSKPSEESLLGDRIPDGSFASHFSALCWQYGRLVQERLGYPVGLISVTQAQSSIADWAPNKVLEECGVAEDQNSGILWNGMISPLLSMSTFGVIWYQGESDTDLSLRYRCTFPKLISHWREEAYRLSHGATDLNFPFGYVQLGPNRPNDKLTFGYTDTRWQQTVNYGYAPNDQQEKTFMAVAADLADFDSPHGSDHPRDKLTIAERLVKGSMSVAYMQKDVTYQGPFPDKYKSTRSNHRLVLTLTSPDVAVRNNSGFEICCSPSPDLFCPASYITASYAPNRTWVPTPIVDHQGSTVTLDWAECAEKHAVAIRYAWRESPCAYKNCAVYDSTSQLPMPPYIRMGLKDDGLEHDLPRNQSNFM